MKKRCLSLFAVSGSLLLCQMQSAPVAAQSFTIGDTKYTDSKVSGTVVGVGAGWVTIQMPKGPMQIIVSDQKLAELKEPFRQPTDPPERTQVVVNGSADPSYVAKDHFVSFSAELKNGKSVAEVQELTLFTPSETQPLGVTGTAGPVDGESGAAASLPEGNCLISGQVASFGKGQMIVTVPLAKGRRSKVTVKVSATAKVGVRTADLSMAQPGDTVSAQGYIASRKGQPPQNQMLAASVEVALAKPLMSKAKRRELAAADGAAKKPTARNTKTEVAKKDPTLPLADNDEPPGLKDPSMPEKPATQKQPDRVDAADVQADDPTPETLVVTDTFVVDETNAFDDEDHQDTKPGAGD